MALIRVAGAPVLFLRLGRTAFGAPAGHSAMMGGGARPPAPMTREVMEAIVRMKELDVAALRRARGG